MRNYQLMPVIAILLIFSSCDVHKESVKTKTETELEENIKSKIFRKGDTVSYKIPNVILRDTTIYTYNRQGTTLKTVYDQSGNLSSIDCFASAIEEMREENRLFRENIKEKEAKKSEEFDSSWVLYIVIGVLILSMFAFTLILISRNNKILRSVVEKVV